MQYDLSAHLVYQLHQPTDLLLHIEAHQSGEQQIVAANIQTSDTIHFARVTAGASLGERIWIRAEGLFHCDYQARIDVTRPERALNALPAVSPHLLPGDTVRYLMPSRFCPSDEFQTFVNAEFGGLTGGARIQAMRDWINASFNYLPGSSNAQTTALDTFVQRQGVCRDFAHVLITLARASTIPARFASVYAPDVTPQDFHAVAEVFLDGAWHLVDATGMASPSAISSIGVGADAAEVAFLSAFGRVDLIEQIVSVTAV